MNSDLSNWFDATELPNDPADAANALQRRVAELEEQLAQANRFLANESLTVACAELYEALRDVNEMAYDLSKDCDHRTLLQAREVLTKYRKFARKS